MRPMILRNFGLFIDGVGRFTTVKTLTPPKLTAATEDWRGGGMDAPMKMDVGMEALEVEMKFGEYDEGVMRRFGLAQQNQVPILARGALQRQGASPIGVRLTMRGGWEEVDFGDWEAGSLTEMTVKGALHYYKWEQAGAVLHEIDVVGGVRVVNGVDHMSEINALIGRETAA